jgi:hypothetical protein
MVWYGQRDNALGGVCCNDLPVLIAIGLEARPATCIVVGFLNRLLDEPDKQCMLVLAYD